MANVEKSWIIEDRRKYKRACSLERALHSRDTTTVSNWSQAVYDTVESILAAQERDDRLIANMVESLTSDTPITTLENQEAA